ncbi:MAG: circularly permuted type 2 ATP-grasp protein [Planctomyces sp.]|nr:circularly permuted type 2 ATP-grasp protein [Planctomyces sp.]
MYCGDGLPRPGVDSVARRMHSMSGDDLARRQAAAEAMLRTLGITFAVYGHSDGHEKVWPFDIVPRIISAAEWYKIDLGLKQRITALNMFLSDVYNERRILADKVIPEDLLESAVTYRPMCRGQRPPQGIWCHVTGTDLVRDRDGTFYVLEDNLRCPSGVSYVLENREVMKRTLPQLFDGLQVVSVDDYPERLLDTLLSVAPPVPDPTVVVLTPGVFNSAYFEHSFLAQQMGVELVEGSDLVIRDGFVHMRTTRGLRRVDVIYRRIDDDFLDPRCFRADSMLGVPGLMEAYRAGRVTLANAPGNGIADDKAVYAYVPKFIKYYLNEDPILPNVPTYVCSEGDSLQYVLDHLDELVVKPVNESGGYGILMGPQSSKEERASFAARIRENPRNYIAQPMLNLSTSPTIIDGRLEPRHVDLRPFILSSSQGVFVLPGGLTRVALKSGSMIVNSSQGGGSKDTWVLADDRFSRRRSNGFSRTSLPVESVPC